MYIPNPQIQILEFNWENEKNSIDKLYQIVNQESKT